MLEVGSGAFSIGLACCSEIWMLIKSDNANIIYNVLGSGSIVCAAAVSVNGWKEAAVDEIKIEAGAVGIGVDKL